jgi:purine-cytosine permease-like protein
MVEAETMAALESMYGTNISLAIIALAIGILIFKLVWYGIALYKTVERKQPVWFTILFVLAIAPISELGIVAIAYLLVYRKRKQKKK